MKTAGFSLIELMITVSIIGILAMITYPTYMSHVTKTRRAEAMSLLLQDAGFMERFYTENGCYRNKGPDGICGSSDDINPDNPAMPPTLTLPFLCSPAMPNSDCLIVKVFYKISLDAASGTNGSTFVLTADPTGTPQANDGTLTLDNNAVRGWSKNPSGNTSSWQ